MEKGKREFRRTENELSGMIRELRDTKTEISEVSTSDDDGKELATDLNVDELVEMLGGVSISSSSSSGTSLMKDHVDLVGGGVSRAEKAIEKAGVNITQLETGVHLSEEESQRF